METETDCRSKEGVTVSLIDAIISIARVLVEHDLESSVAVREALLDLASDEDLRSLSLMAEHQSFKLDSDSSTLSVSTKGNKRVRELRPVVKKMIDSFPKQEYTNIVLLDELINLWFGLRTVPPELETVYWDKVHEILMRHLGVQDNLLWEIFTGRFS